MTFQESTHPKHIPLNTLVRDLGVRLAGSWLEPIIEEFRTELRAKGIHRIQPQFYLSNEWGVPFGTTAIAIPFYLARSELMALHAEQVGHVEGETRIELLRYLRHEMGHVINYGYRLYDREDWVNHFGSLDRPYIEEYRPEPFSRRFVRHLPGWYAQKHPDEDWAETFAVWMTPGLDWSAEYTGWPEALAKLRYCDRVLAELRERDPIPSDEDPDDTVDDLTWTLDEYYHEYAPAAVEQPPGLDGSLRAIFEEDRAEERPPDRRPASTLIRRLERHLLADVYHWTGHFPERTRVLLQQMAQRADHLRQVYPVEREMKAAVALTTLVTALAMNYVHRGNYSS
jgi:hypothetical protein